MGRAPSRPPGWALLFPSDGRRRARAHLRLADRTAVQSPLRSPCPWSAPRGAGRPEARGQRGQSTWKGPRMCFPVAVGRAGVRPSWQGPMSASPSAGLARQAMVPLRNDGEGESEGKPGGGRVLALFARKGKGSVRRISEINGPFGQNSGRGLSASALSVASGRPPSVLGRTANPPAHEGTRPRVGQPRAGLQWGAQAQVSSRLGLVFSVSCVPWSRSSEAPVKRGRASHPAARCSLRPTPRCLRWPGLGPCVLCRQKSGSGPRVPRRRVGHRWFPKAGGWHSYQEKGTRTLGRPWNPRQAGAGLKHRCAGREPAFVCQSHSFFYGFLDAPGMWGLERERVSIWKGLRNLGSCISSCFAKEQERAQGPRDAGVSGCSRGRGGEGPAGRAVQVLKKSAQLGEAVASARRGGSRAAEGRRALCSPAPQPSRRRTGEYY